MQFLSTTAAPAFFAVVAALFFMLGLLTNGSCVSAQQATPQGADPAFLQQALNALQAQRNRALDEAAGAEAQLAQAQKTISDLQKQVADPKAAAPAPKPSDDAGK
jgi:hypothetical protein